MLPLTSIPTIVEHYAPHFEHIFSEEAYEHFKRFLSGLLISENKTVEAINRLFVVQARNQSSLNRFMTESPYEDELVNDSRLSMLQSHAATRLKGEGMSSGVLSLDDTILPHYGKHFDHISLQRDYVNECYVMGHKLVTLFYSDDQAGYPLHWHLWLPADLDTLQVALQEAQVYINPTKLANKLNKPAQWRAYLLQRHGLFQYQHPALQEVYQNKMVIGQGLLKKFFDAHPHLDLPVAFDSFYTAQQMCQYVNEKLKRAYVGALKASNEVILSGNKKKKLTAFVAQLKAEHQEHLAKGLPAVFEKTTYPYKGKKEVCYTYCASHRIASFAARQRLVIQYSKQDLSDEPRFLISNRLHWHASGICRIWRHRWPIEEYHQEGKAEGLAKYQLRDFQAIQRHIAFVVVVYSMLQCARHDAELLSKLQCKIEPELDGSLAYWRRLISAEALCCLVQWIFLMIESGNSIHDVLKPLMKTMTH